MMSEAKINIVDPEVELLTLGPVRMVETAYRICYQSLDRMTPGSHTLIKKYLYPEDGDSHQTPLEHVNVEVLVPGVVAQAVMAFQQGASFTYVAVFSDTEVGDHRWYMYGNLRAFFTIWTEMSLYRSAYSAEHLAAAQELNRAFASKFPEIFDYEVIVGNPVMSLSDDAIKINVDLCCPSFRIVTTRDILQEFVRHRQLSFNVESTRYCNYKKRGFTFVRPKPYEWAELDHDPKFQLWFHTAVTACENYLDMLKEGAGPEEARMLLPGGLKTEFIVTAPQSAWEHFCDLRCSDRAHPQIKLLADQINKYLFGG